MALRRAPFFYSQEKGRGKKRAVEHDLSQFCFPGKEKNPRPLPGKGGEKKSRRSTFPLWEGKRGRKKKIKKFQFHFYHLLGTPNLLFEKE